MSVRIEPHAEPIPGYRLIDQIGAGGFGEVWKAEAPGGIFKAIKIIHGDMRSKDNDIVRYAEQELKALKRVQQVRHPYLLALDRYDIVDGRLMIVMELADCNLWDRFREYRNLGLPGIPRDELLLYLSETAEVLDLFNDQFQLQHLDIKPQNLFLLYNHVKVADFGQVKDLEGLLATVTGGITPVYAAPETFDGLVTRYCDQYSLACVYQELLTGQRPFDGSSMSQLLMQHMNMAPNLQPSPPADRPVLARALAKKPEDRWPTVSAFVHGLLQADPNLGRGASAAHLSPIEHPTTLAPEKRAGSYGNTQLRSSAPLPRLVVPGTGPIETPLPRPETEMAGSSPSTAPPEISGPGPLRPGLIIGIGQAGLRVLQRLRFDLAERHGPPEMLPAIRTLFIDTDQDALDEALKPRPLDRLAKLAPESIFPAKLNRATHYTKPRLSGRALTDGWFDQQLIYKIPRGLQTGGMRIFGRLAFLDHYRMLMAKVQTELDAALSTDALASTEKRTGLSHRTSRPVVYIATGLCGGTGSGMFLDMAYSVRSRLMRMGYSDPEVIGVLMLPTADTTTTPPQALANTFAALTELNHYGRPDTTFTASYEDRTGTLEDKAPPFSLCFVVPGNAAGLKLPPPTAMQQSGASQSRTPTSPNEFRTTRPGSGAVPQSLSQRSTEASNVLEALKPYGSVADLIRLNLFSEVGRTADEIRAIPADGAPPPEGVTVAAFGLSGFSWPRAEVVARTTRKIAKLVLTRWATTDPRRAREVIPALAQDKWTQHKFDPEVVQGRLQLAADIAGDRIEEQIILTADPLAPRGWLARLPEPGPVKVVIDRLVRLLGPPASVMKQAPTAVEQALNKTVQETGAAFVADVQSLVPAMVNDSQFRLAGTEEMLRQFLATTDRFIAQFLKAAGEFDAKAQAGFERVSQYAHFHQGGRKLTVAEFGEAIKQFPRARFQALLSRSAVGIYQTLREALAAKLGEVKKARERLEAAAQTPNSTVEVIEHLPGSGGPRLLPPGCDSVGAAVLRFVGVITDADLAEIDQRIHQVITPTFGGVLQACSSSQTGPDDVVAAIYEETRAHLDLRLGRVDMSLMFAERYRTAGQAEAAIAQTFQNAEPSWIGAGPWSTSEVTVAGCLCGPGGDRLHEVIQRAIPVPGLVIADTPDDLLIYREWPHVPLGVLTQLGPASAAAYQTFADGPGGTVHSRLDVIRWYGADDV
ncbi:MAG: protein kinase [Planctomycetes bacterium]|nr:protein kinase [Planctomycetota bacterium]